MDWMNQLGGLLQKYTGGQQPAQQSEEQVHQDFDNVAQTAPKQSLVSALASAFRSDQTPPFGQMVSQLFGHSSGEQKAGLLNQLLAMSPGVAASQLGDLLRGKNQITPEEAQKISPEQVKQMAAQAEQQNPSIVDQLSDFYSQHPTLIKGLGASALAFLIGKVAERHHRSGA